MGVSWFAVDEALPPPGADILLACADGVQQGVLRGRTFRSCLRGPNPVSDATHWALMPPHPLNEPSELQ